MALYPGAFGPRYGGGLPPYANAANPLGSLMAQQVNQQMMQAFAGIQPGQLVTPEQQPALDKKKLAALKRAGPRIVLRLTPDFVKPLTAWRAWGVGHNDEWRLVALAGGSNWEPKRAIPATCSHMGNHPAPHKTCGCGYWTFSSLEHLEKALDGYQPSVIGECHIWGRVIECENGYRSQFAYPKELWLLDESMEQLGYIYGVPIRTAK